MKIEVMQMNKRIAIGKYVTVLFSCHAQQKKNVLGKSYLCGTRLTLKSLTYIHCFIDPIKCQEKRSRFQAVAMLGSA